MLVICHSVRQSLAAAFQAGGRTQRRDPAGGPELRGGMDPSARASITVNDERPARRGAPLPGLIHAATDLTSWSRGFDSSVYAHQRHQLKPGRHPTVVLRLAPQDLSPLSEGRHADMLTPRTQADVLTGENTRQTGGPA